MASRQVRRTEIMEAAIELFARQGFHAAKIEDIAATAAIGKGTVYEYFPSKQHLFHDSLDYLLSLYNEGLADALTEAAELGEGLRSFVDYQMGAYERSVCLVQSLTAIPVSLTQELKLLWERQQAETLSCLEDFLTRVLPKDVPLSRASYVSEAIVIYGAVNQYCLQRMLSGKLDEEDQKALQSLVRTIEYGVRRGGASE
jgi:AcrR family transcriptional regulator